MALGTARLCIHLCPMAKHPRHLCAILCMLLLNVQAFAANALDCVHQGAVPAIAECPHHQTQTQPQTGPLADLADTLSGVDERCQKCDLDEVAVGWHLYAQSPPTLSVGEPESPRTLLATPLPTRAPDGLLRPPQDLSALPDLH